MEQRIETVWASNESTTRLLNDACKRAQVLSGKMHDACREGNPAALQKATDSLSESLGEIHRLGELLAAERNLTGASATDHELLDEILYALKVAFPDRRIWRSFGEFIVYPVRIGFRLGHPKFVINGESLTSTRPSAIVAAVSKALSASRSPKRFAAALYGAFLALNREPETISVPLDALHQVLTALPPEHGSYPQGDFAADLQAFVAEGLEQHFESYTIRFTPVSAGNRAIPVFAPNGDLVNLANVEFHRRKDAND